MIDANEQLITALDMPSAEAHKLMFKLPDESWVKIGLELFTEVGVSAVFNARNHFGLRVFLDLKFKDIPNTVERAVRSAGKLGVSMVNIHLDGTRDMIKAAVRGAEGFPNMKLLGVTVLTSMTDASLSEIGIYDYVESQVLKLATLGSECGIDGFICSPQEIKVLRNNFSKDFIIVTPGVRSQGVETHDQIRVSTPEQAIEDGADFIVCGREITGASNPSQARENIIKRINERN